MNDIIKKYYKNVDEPIINDYLNNNKYKNLLELSTKNDIPIFNKGKKKWKIKNSKQMINDCKSKKKKKLKNLSNIIKELAKDPGDETLKKIKIINKEAEKDINNIDDMIKEISKKKNKKKDVIKINNYLEIYEN